MVRTLKAETALGPDEFAEITTEGARLIRCSVKDNGSVLVLLFEADGLDSWVEVIDRDGRRRYLLDNRQVPDAHTQVAVVSTGEPDVVTKDRAKPKTTGNYLVTEMEPGETTSLIELAGTLRSIWHGREMPGLYRHWSVRILYAFGQKHWRDPSSCPLSTENEPCNYRIKEGARFVFDRPHRELMVDKFRARVRGGWVPPTQRVNA